jgi:hypothetical protein
VRLRKFPLLYEINTWTWLYDLSLHYDRNVTLGSVPDAELDRLAEWGLDAVWLMGVWERSPTGRTVALEHPGLQEEYHRALPDFVPGDVVGSPYAVHCYEADPRLGGRDELAAIRSRLAERGLALVLDFVPNHVAVDHPWLQTYPECFVQGTVNERDAQPDHFFSVGSRVFAHGRDPYFPPWTDTAQLNAFSPSYRARAVDTLVAIASQCDGVRCDMAMLVTNRVFQQTWGDRAARVPEVEFWDVVIPAVKGQFPDFLFMAEVYWDMEWDLQQQGFDYTYDKRLYDRLKNQPARSILGHLQADPTYQEHMIRFIENHDELRATVALGPGRDLAAAVLITTLPGATLLHDGQFVGHQVKLPVQLGRRPSEPDNLPVETFYRMLMGEVRHPIYHEGAWQLRDCVPAWDLNATHRNLIAYSWRQGDERRLMVINYAPSSSQGRVLLPGFDLAGQKWCLYDVMHLAEYERDGDQITRDGLYVDLPAWQTHIFRFREMPEEAAP